MKMGSEQGIERIQPKGEVYKCPVCNYTDGFHVSFNMEAGSNLAEIVLICPSCHRRFNIGWKVQLEQE
ncbi:MAG: hypothetical protein JRK26_16385 [Deltaproteobacteria bacterium]|nr:hypothetical protein [Deltaproteobacteria bacterium]